MSILCKKVIGVLIVTGFFWGCDQATPVYYEIDSASSSSVSGESSSSAVSKTSSSSAVSENSSSSSVLVNSSSSVSVTSSSSAVFGNSSSSFEDVSSVISSSSVFINSSSSEQVLSSSSLDVANCDGFVEGTMREHYGKLKPQFCDERDGKKYVYVEINGKTWMAENLNYSTDNSLCYGNESESCDTFGRLYFWIDVMNGTLSSDGNPSGVRGVCPSGWHLPSRSEWNELADFVGDDSAIKLMAADWQGTDDYGFSTLAGGEYLYNAGRFNNRGRYAHWWSATDGSAVGYGSVAYRWYITEDEERLAEYTGYKTNGYSVRCLKD